MKLTAEKLAHAISNFIESYESTDALTILRDEFRLTDEQIREMGLDYLFDFAEEDEPEEEPLKTYTFVYRADMGKIIEIEAHNETEATALAEQECEQISYDSMECMDYSLELIGPQE